MNKTIRDIFTGMLFGDGHIRRSGVNKAYITFERLQAAKTDYVNIICSNIRLEAIWK